MPVASVPDTAAILLPNQQCTWNSVSDPADVRYVCRDAVGAGGGGADRQPPELTDPVMVVAVKRHELNPLECGGRGVAGPVSRLTAAGGDVMSRELLIDGRAEYQYALISVSVEPSSCFSRQCIEG